MVIHSDASYRTHVCLNRPVLHPGEPRADLRKPREEPSIYLVEVVEFLDDFPDIIDKYWECIFQEQLNGWMRDPDLWPEELTRKMFLEWFDCELSTMIWDMLKAKIKPAF